MWYTWLLCPCNSTPGPEYNIAKLSLFTLLGIDDVGSYILAHIAGGKVISFRACSARLLSPWGE